MSEHNVTSFDQLTMHKDVVHNYLVSAMRVEMYDKASLTEALFPPRYNMQKDCVEMQSLVQMEKDAAVVQEQLDKVTEALNKFNTDGQRYADMQQDPAKQKKLEEIETYSQQLQSRLSEMEQSQRDLTNRCMQQVIQYISIVPDHLLAHWRYEKGYLLVFLNDQPDYFNADSNKVTFSDVWRYDDVYTIRGKINDFYKKLYMEFIIIWKKGPDS